MSSIKPLSAATNGLANLLQAMYEQIGLNRQQSVYVLINEYGKYNNSTRAFRAKKGSLPLTVL